MFSVVIPTRDRSDQLRHALDSVLDQSIPAGEVVVVDDGSVDGTAAILRAEFEPRGVRVLQTGGEGVCVARNAGVEAASSEWVIFLDDDDVPNHRWLETHSSLTGPDVAFTAASIRLTWSDGVEELLLPEKDVSTGYMIRFLPGAFAIRRELLRSVGGFMPGLTFSEHTELSMRLLPHCAEAGYTSNWTDEVVLTMRRERDRRSAKGRHIAIQRVLEAHEETFAADPARRAQWLSIAGVDAFRARDRRAARRLLAEAFRARPSLISSARLVGVHVAPLGKRLWGEDAPTPAADVIPR